MQIRWFFEDIEPSQIRGPLATSEDGNYQIVFDYNSLLHFYLYHNSDCIAGFNVECDITGLCVSDLLVKCHRVIEKNITTTRICGNCSHLIFKDYEHHEGTCSITRLHRNFELHCIHEEEMS